MVSADEDKNGYISVEEVEHTLEHIGASERVTRKEIELAMKELGAEDNQIQVEELKGLLSDKRGLGVKAKTGS